ncbi:PepSY-associated TM helix domain-containing protein, partial [Paucibacter sp. XJ19-41]|uniref:PepSY-associated TM helix domain-containing protein n=1 Tax=Paucibacter sp. XJ19-41 TaxID=2927824 RepID=UPI00234BF7A2
LPPRGARRLARWGPAWTLRWRGAGWHKRLFDAHRAGGLWPWALLFVLAWSSVGFNLDPVYSPVMRTLFEHQPEAARSQGQPVLDWAQALPIARARAAEAAQARGFTILQEVELSRRPGAPVYQLRLQTERDLNQRRGATRLFIDAHDGRLLGLYLPRGAAAGDTVSTWLVNLHLGSLWGWPYQVLVLLMGLAVAVGSAPAGCGCGGARGGRGGVPLLSMGERIGVCPNSGDSRCPPLSFANCSIPSPPPTPICSAMPPRARPC